MSRLALALLAVLAISWAPPVPMVAGIGPTLIVSHGSAGPPPPPPGPPVTGYTIWLDASASGNSNTLWLDQSGNGNSAVPPGTSPGAVLTAAAINGLQAYVFNGVNDRLSVPALAVPGDLTAFLVFQSIVPNNSDALIDANRSSGFLLAYNVGAHAQYWYAGSAFSTSSAVDTSTHLMAIVRSSATGQMTGYLDGVVVSSTTTSAATATTARDFAFFGLAAGFANVKLGEYAEYASTLTSGQLTSWHTYSSTKWGTP